MRQGPGVRGQGSEQRPRGGAGKFWTRRRYVGLLVAFVAVHALLAVALSVSGDEAYYWDCSRHPDWATYDQPPLMMLAPIPFRVLLGETRLAVRGPAILASFLIGVFLLPLVRRLGGGPREAAWAYLVLHATPLFFLGSFYASTDIGMMAGYVGATWAAVAIAQGERCAWWGFGVAVALGFLAKFPAVLVLPALAPALMRSEVRAHLRTPVPYAAAALSMLLTAPVWIWGSRHGWVNLTFQLQQRHSPGSVTLLHVGEFLALVALLASPPLAVAIGMAWWRGWRRKDRGWAALLAGAAAPLAFFSLVALREEVAPHWAGPAIVLGTVALACTARRPRWLIRSGVAFGLVISLAATAAVVLVPRMLLVSPPFVGGVGERLAGTVSPAVGNEEIVTEIKRRLRPGELVASESYTNVHLFAFLSGGTLPTRLARVRGGAHGLASLYWYRPEELVGRNFLFVTEREGMLPPLAEIFTEVTEEPPFLVERGGTVVRRVLFLRCRLLRHPEGTFTRLAPSPSLGPAH
jgi:4-amino-4-deoxy-L-arabinose transferase-like glycosyltransferase